MLFFPPPHSLLPSRHLFNWLLNRSNRSQKLWAAPVHGGGDSTRARQTPNLDQVRQILAAPPPGQGWDDS